MTDAVTDSDGYYEINNLPDVSDYILTVYPKNYAQQEKTNVASGSDEVDFTLSDGGSIQGQIIDANGPLSGVQVVASSVSLNTMKSTITNSSGKYSFKGLKAILNGQNVSDYKVTAYADDYPSITKTEKTPADNPTVNFKFTSGDENEITGNVKDSSGAEFPSDGSISITILVFDSSSNLLQFGTVDQDGTFSIKGLNPDVNYTLRFLTNDDRSGSTNCDTSMIIYYKFGFTW